MIATLPTPTPFRLVGYGVAINCGADKLRFLEPVPCGTEVHARTRLVAVHGRAAGTLVRREIEVAVVGRPRPALRYVGLTLFQPPR